jgi:hypothetical protein
MIAAYVELRLSEWERAAFERRLVDEPALLDALIASRAALASPALAAPPQALTAFALNLAPAPTRRQPAHRQPMAPGAARRRRRFALPSLAWSLATAAFLGAFAIGAIVTWQFAETAPIVAEQTKQPPKDALQPKGSPVLHDPVPTSSGRMTLEKK